MQFLQLRFTDKIYSTGIVFLSLSLLFFCLGAFDTALSESQGGIFILNFFLTISYAVLLFTKRAGVPADVRRARRGILFVLGLISAYALNWEMGVFDESVGWFSIVVSTVAATQLLLAYTPAMPRILVYALSILNSLATATFLYLSIYLVPMFVFGIIGLPAIGISAHVFIPVFLLAHSIVNQYRLHDQYSRAWIPYTTGLVAIALGIVFFVSKWHDARQQVATAINRIDPNSGLPEWLQISQHLPLNFFTERVIKADVVYSVPSGKTVSLFGSGWFPNGIRPKHDPLVMISSAYFPAVFLNTADKIKIIGAAPSLQHESERTLWSGDRLRTRQVKTEVKTWPACNIAYTEKTVTVGVTPDHYERTPQEAIYTFYMPEGSVVSSLSLWVNGVEEKGILTTKEKADTAYQAIVGVEKRDPSVVHWREGNTVAVRVFPVTHDTPRQFKIGFTSPLANIAGKLQYHNIHFDGPPSDGAEEVTDVQVEQVKGTVRLPSSFAAMAGKSAYHRKGKYIPEWTMEIDDPGASGCGFSFNGSTYTLSNYHRKLMPVTIDAVYLDINTTWTRRQFEEVLAASGSRRRYAWNNGIVEITSDNKNEIWQQLSQRNFSMFPFHLIKSPETALVVTQKGISDPLMIELQNSNYLREARRFFKDNGRIRLFSLGEDISPYIASFKEQRAFQFDHGTSTELTGLLMRGHFPEDTEKDQQVVIHTANMVVSKSPGMGESEGPDHVMRLFAYNHIMQQLGRREEMKAEETDTVMREATEAHIVTPVSSLIVLETKADYERFGIKEQNNTLKNATLQNKGAAPEPHEWALIALALITVFHVLRKKRMAVA